MVLAKFSSPWDGLNKLCSSMLSRVIWPSKRAALMSRPARTVHSRGEPAKGGRSGTWCSCRSQDGSDVDHRVGFPSGDVHDELEGFIVGQGDPAAVDAVEGDGPGEGEPLVAVDKSTVPGQRVKQSRSLGIQARVGIEPKAMA